MQLRKIIAFWLCALIVVSNVLGASGGLFLCLHENGEVHEFSKLSAKDVDHGCDHDHTELEPEEPHEKHGENCIDLEISGGFDEFTLWRSLIDVQLPTAGMMAFGHFDTIDFRHDRATKVSLSRAPPDISIRSIHLSVPVTVLMV